MKVKLDRFYISTPIKNRYNFKYDKKNKIRPSWIQIKNAPKGTHWVKILKNGEAFWYRIYFKDYYFPIKYDFKDYENYYDEIADKYESFVPQNKK